MKKEERKQKRMEGKEERREKRNKYIEVDTAAPVNRLRKIGHIYQTGTYPTTSELYVRRAFE